MRTTDIFKTKAKTLKESFEKTFGQKLKLETFSVSQLEDARNRLRTQIHQVRNGGNFNETVENEAFTKAQWMLDSINAELAERFEQAAIHPVAEENKEVDLSDFDFPEDGRYGYKMGNGGVGYGSNNQFRSEGLTIVDRETGKVVNHSDFTYFDEEPDQDELEYWFNYSEESVKEGDGSESETMRQIASGELDAYDVLNNPKGPDQEAASKIMQQMYDDISIDNRLHPDDDFEEILDLVVDRIADDYGYNDDGGETDDAYALASAGHGSDEDYGSYESQTQGNDMTRIRESAADKAGAVVVAKDMTDKVGRWIEELSGMENDQLISLGDTIRDEMGQDAAKAYLEAVAPAIQQALGNLKQTREILASGMRQLTGEEQSAEIIGSEPADGTEGEVAPAAPDTLNPEAGAEGGEDFFGGEEPASDEFGAAEPAAGGLEQAGREKRESIDFQNRLLKVLAG